MDVASSQRQANELLTEINGCWCCRQANERMEQLSGHVAQLQQSVQLQLQQLIQCGLVTGVGLSSGGGSDRSGELEQAEELLELKASVSAIKSQVHTGFER